MGDYEPQAYTGNANTVYGGWGDDKIFGGDGNDNIRGDVGNDEIHGGFNHALLSAGSGGDRLDGGDGNDLVVGAGTLLGGTGDDTLRLTGDSVVFTGTGRDIVQLAFHEVDGLFDIPEEHINTMNVTVADFTRGIDKLSISEQDATLLIDPAPQADFRVTFADLDTNHSGVLTSSDQGITVGRVSFNGETKTSMTIDLDFGHVDPLSFSHGSLTLFGVTSLTAGDIVSA